MVPVLRMTTVSANMIEVVAKYVRSTFFNNFRRRENHNTLLRLHLNKAILFDGRNGMES